MVGWTSYVWYVCIVLPLKAAIVSSTNPDSFKVSVWILTWRNQKSNKTTPITVFKSFKLVERNFKRQKSAWMSYFSATAKQLSIAAGVHPQSSCSFSPIAPALIISCISSGFEVFPWSVKRCIIVFDFGQGKIKKQVKWGAPVEKCHLN